MQVCALYKESIQDGQSPFILYDPVYFGGIEKGNSQFLPLVFKEFPLVRRHFGKGHHGPENNRNSEDDGARLFDVLPGPFPGMNEKTFQGRHAIGRKLHDKG